MPIQVLSKELQDKAEKELNEVPGKTQENVEQIRNWLVIKHPHVIARTDDLFLLNFLRGCKFNLQVTKDKLDFFYRIRSTTPEFFENRDPFSPEIQECLKQGIILPLESDTTPTTIMRWKFDFKKVRIQTILKVCFMFFDIMLNENNSFMITGNHLVHDFDGFSLNGLRGFTPSLCKKIFLIAQRAYPLRMAGIHWINSMAYSAMIFNLFKHLMSKKFRERSHIYDRSQSSKIFDSISKSAVPYEYGGEGGSIEEIRDKFKIKMESYRDWFLADEQRRLDENRNSDKLKTCIDVHEVKENFRKLEID